MRDMVEIGMGRTARRTYELDDINIVPSRRTRSSQDVSTAWQLDVFGHDPQFPGMAADAGLTSSSWARGPHHQWGPMHRDGEVPTGLMVAGLADADEGIFSIAAAAEPLLRG